MDEPTWGDVLERLERLEANFEAGVDRLIAKLDEAANPPADDTTA